jgi:hypothetical protein
MQWGSTMLKVTVFIKKQNADARYDDVRQNAYIHITCESLQRKMALTSLWTTCRTTLNYSLAFGLLVTQYTQLCRLIVPFCLEVVLTDQTTKSRNDSLS